MSVESSSMNPKNEDRNEKLPNKKKNQNESQQTSTKSHFLKK